MIKRNRKQKLQLEESQISDVLVCLEQFSSKIITNELWKFLEPKLKMSKKAFTRRATVSKFSIRLGCSWEEFATTGCPTKTWVQLNCIHCDLVYVARAIKLLGRNHRTQTCVRCYRKHHLYDEVWRERNSASQFIAQNREETLEKHRKNSRNLWIGEQGNKMRAAQLLTVSNESYKENMAQVMRQKWATDSGYRDRVSGKGKYKHVGIFESEIVYHSKLELAFLLWCQESKLQVKRSDLVIDYFDPLSQKNRRYYPDFEIDNKMIVEVKGQRWIDVAPLTWQAKFDALQMWCDANDKSCKVFLDKDLASYVRKALIYHETQKKIDNTL